MSSFEGLNFARDYNQNNIQTGLNQLEDLVGVRTKAIEKRLKGVETLSEDEAGNILPGITDDITTSDEDP